MLVPEDALLNDPEPLQQTVRLMVGINDEPLEDEDPTRAGVFYLAVLTCPGGKAEVRPLETPRIVKYQRGDLSIDQESNVTHVWKRPLNGDRQFKQTFDYTFSRHADVEAGFADASFTLTWQIDDNTPKIQRFSYYLNDVGWKKPVE